MPQTPLGTPTTLNHSGHGDYWCPWCGYKTAASFRARHWIKRRDIPKPWGRFVTMFCNKTGKTWRRCIVKIHLLDEPASDLIARTRG